MLKGKIIGGKKLRITDRDNGGYKFTVIPEGGSKGNRFELIAIPSAKARRAYEKMVNEAGTHVPIKYEITEIDKRGNVIKHTARIL